MPLPAGVETVTVSTGDSPLCLPDGTWMQGRLIVTGPDLVTVGEDDLVLGGTVEVPLVDGEFSVTLAATDATGMSPTGWTYTVTAALSNAPNWRRYISLPKATPDVVLADILVPDPAEGAYSVLVDPAALLAKSANLSDLESPSAARTSLGLGTSATRSVGDATGTVAAGDDARITGAVQATTAMLLTGGQETFPRWAASNSSSITMSSGALRLAYFTARRTATVTGIRINSGSTVAGATPTLARLALY